MSRRNVIGPPAIGENFFDRTDELRRLWRDLDSGNNLLLLAPRRVGKTSLLRKLEDDAWAQGWAAAYVSVADAATESDLIQLLLKAVLAKDAKNEIRRALASKWKKSIGPVVSRVDELSFGELGVKLREPDAPGWRDLLTDLESALPLVRERWVIALDEFPLFIQKLIHNDGNSDRAREFLIALREFRQRRVGDHAATVQWILSGSIGLDGLAQRHRMVTAINDLKLFPLGELTRQAADELVETVGMLEGLDLNAATRSHLLDRAEWLIPYHLKILVSSLRDEAERGGDEPSPALVDRAFEALIGPDYRSYFDSWSVRLDEDLGAIDSEYARVILAVAARDPQGAPIEVLSAALQPRLSESEDAGATQRRLLDLLERDGYLIPSDGRWRFRSPLLRGYWLRRFVQ